MKKIIFVIAAILSLSTSPCFSEVNYNVCWQKGNDFYSKKIYDSAAFYFEQIAALKPHKEEVYYNLGNTYYRLNKVGMAVLNYERALKINPEHKESRENLMLTLNRINNHLQPSADIFFITWWNNMTRPDKASVSTIVALIIFFLIIAILALRRFNKSFGHRIPVQLQYILGLSWLFFLIVALIASNKCIKPTGAVVMQNETPLMNNELTGKPITLIPEGTTINLVAENGSWLEVRLPDGRVGWIQQNLVEKI